MPVIESTNTPQAVGRATNKPLSPLELSTFCAQMGMLLRAGITVQEGILVLYDDSRGTAAEGIYSSILEKVEMGSSLYDGLASAGVFPPYLLQMVQIGEVSGKLDEVMDALCEYYERNEAISKGIRNAISYPAIMLGMMAVVVYILVVEVLPIFGQVFRQLGSELSPFALGLLNLGGAVSHSSALLIFVVAALVIGGLLLRRTARGRTLFHSLGRIFPPTRRLTEKISAGRFVSALSMMLSSGLDTDQALTMSAQLVEDPHTREKIQGCQKAVEEGKSFAEALLSSGLFPGLYARMVTVGFKTGTVDGVMRKLATRYEEEIDDAIGILLSILEPSLVALLSISVGMVLLSVILPLMGVMSSIG